MNTRLLSPWVTRFLLVIMLYLPVWGNQVSAQTPESYAVLDEATGTLTFRHDAKKPAGAYPLNSSKERPGWFVEGENRVNKNRIEKVVFDASFAAARPTSCCCWFAGCMELKTIEGIEYLNTENVTDLSWMFFLCYSLTKLDVSNFDTQKVAGMDFMFAGCSNLTTLDISNFNTKKVTAMSGMFSGCSNLTTIYVSDKFVTTACEYGDNMFGNCGKLVGAVPYDESKTGMEMANCITGYFTDIKTTGINATPISDNIAAKYYDVLGRRMDAPQKGINIVKRGGRTMKVLVK